MSSGMALPSSRDIRTLSVFVSALAALAAARDLPSPARAYGTGARAREEARLAAPLALFERRVEAVIVDRLPLSDSCQLGRRMQAEVPPKHRCDVRRGSAESQPKRVDLTVSRLLHDVCRPTLEITYITSVRNVIQA